MGNLVRLRAIASIVFVVVLGAAGCRQIAGLGDPGTIDGAGGDDGIAGPLCFGTGLVKVCFDTTPTSDLSFAVAVNTDGTGCATNVTSGGEGLCVVDARTITVPAGLVVSATGSKPLVIVGADTITIEGTVDVSSKHMSGTGMHGGGADFTACVVPTSPAGGSDGGGAGGSFAGIGGDGGDPSHASATAGLGEPTTLHGGCSGGNGADNSNRGHSGGAVALIAGNHIDVMGQVDASGAGGSSQNDFAFVSLGGGGGGGSGGMIILDAATISIGGVVFANGGGGGEGGTATNPGHSGNDPANGGVGMGGTGSGTGGDGGDGGAVATVDGAPGGAGVAGSAGGGGGGGSVGVIRIDGERTVTGTVSPAAP